MTLMSNNMDRLSRLGLLEEPLGYVDGMNLYEYVRSTPSGHTDPSGLRMLAQPNPPSQIAPIPGGGNKSVRTTEFSRGDGLLGSVKLKDDGLDVTLSIRAGAQVTWELLDGDNVKQTRQMPNGVSIEVQAKGCKAWQLVQFVTQEVFDARGARIAGSWDSPLGKTALTADPKNPAIYLDVLAESKYPYYGVSFVAGKDTFYFPNWYEDDVRVWYDQPGYPVPIIQAQPAGVYKSVYTFRDFIVAMGGGGKPRILGGLSWSATYTIDTTKNPWGEEGPKYAFLGQTAGLLASESKVLNDFMKNHPLDAK